VDNVSANERRGELLHILRRDIKTDAAKIKMELNVSRHTIMRDITALTLDGHDIDTARGHGGGVIYRGYYPFRNFLTKKEDGFLRNLLSNLEGEQAEIMGGIIKKLVKLR
jgi:predicted DNA-binding transcriptional regulator YafY